MRYAVLLTASLLALAACSNEPDVEVKNATVEEVANEVAEATTGEGKFIRAGRWSSTMTLEELAAPGMPAEIAEQMKAQMGSGRVSETCLTQDQVEKPSPELFAGKNNQCRYDHFKMGDGKIDAKMRCQQGGASQVMEMDGSYSPNDYRMQMTTSTEGEGPVAGITMRMRIDAKRIGECTKTKA